MGFSAEIANGNEWSSKEIHTSFQYAEYLQRQIHHNFGGSSLVHVGFLYLSVGHDFGKSTIRYIILVPFYDPSEDCYYFKVNSPFVYMRGFAAVASYEFFNHLKDSWEQYAKELPQGAGQDSLLKCAPVHIYKFEGNDAKKLEYCPSTKSPNDFLSIYDSFLEFGIHGPRNVQDAIRSLPDSFDYREFQCLVENAVYEADDALTKLKECVESYRQTCRSFSFPTFQLEIKNPMDGHLPFPVKNLRVIVDETGNRVGPSSSSCNEVYIKAAAAEPPTLIHLDCIWSLLLRNLPDNLKTDLKNKKVFEQIIKAYNDLKVKYTSCKAIFSIYKSLMGKRIIRLECIRIARGHTNQ